MYVKKVDILNIRSYKNAHIEFTKGINLIVGANNSGKSTILKCLQKLQSSNVALDITDIRKQEELGALRIQLSEITEKEHAYFFRSLSRNYPIGDVSIIYELRNTEEKVEILSNLYNENVCKVYASSSGIVPMPLSSAGFGLEPTSTLFEGFSPMENKNNFIYLFLSKRKSNHYTGSSGKDSAYRIDDDLRNLPSRFKLLSNQSHQFHKEFTTACNEILGFPIGSVSSASNNNEDKLGLLVKHDTIYLESMGDGVANILGLLSILYSENEGRKLFLIEEIENDIHPEALKKLLNVILEKSNDHQFIISTHSNIVLKYLATANDAKMFFTDWSVQPSEENAKIKIPTSIISELENTQFNRLEILAKLGYDIFDFDLFKSYIVFEESSAEQIIRDFIIPEFVPSLHKKVKTIGAKGVDKIDSYFDDFLRLFVYLNGDSIYKFKAWVVADGDNAGLTNIKNLRTRYSDWPKENFINFQKNDFEEYYPEMFREKFLEIDKIQNKKLRFESKGKLTQEVMTWISQDKESAIREFRQSAKEVIEILSQISKSLNL